MFKNDSESITSRYFLTGKNWVFMLNILTQEHLIKKKSMDNFE